jgi:hypothetical protein
MRFLRLAPVLIPVALAGLLSEPHPAPATVLRWPAVHTQFRSIQAGARHRYAVNLKAGQYARVVVDQRDIDLGLSVSGPGVELPEINGSDYGKEPVSILARAPGAYIVYVIASKNDSTRGAYRIALTELRLARPQLSIAETSRWRSPYYWVGVLLYGDWRPMWKLD